SECFFFQADDGIRDFHVTGVQTCALPISLAFTRQSWRFRYSSMVLETSSRVRSMGAVMAGVVMRSLMLVVGARWTGRSSRRPDVLTRDPGCRRETDKGRHSGSGLLISPIPLRDSSGFAPDSPA